ncbi:pentapeptide repeat-containing protein [Nodularia harveyana UHCC-0300]|uniref:Pentapeptide repeat-containing protein n=1 Tax=Nodularia harveyana UHCC-0300 TaxID=2974287 RepID=A0ABU5UGH8_9CYAN|nr:pentapeptide repeat-containing protein [Nodularia harveyana]MEA5582652.1 pentapeptide repeat-containing protein [Nodularia harveyana UHCC-0300]
MLMAIINTLQIFEKLTRYLDDHPISLTNFIPGIFVDKLKSLQLSFQSGEEYLFRVRKNLNDQHIENRLAAIHDLAKFSQAYPKYQGEIMMILSNFVQNHHADINGDEFNPHSLPRISEDLQVALTVIGRRDTNHDQEGEQIDLSCTDISGANLYQANLKSSNLYQVNLTGANLTGANLAGAILTGANLTGANLQGANLAGAILCAANLTGANLTGANLTGANLYLANLQGATLNDAMLQGANFREAKFV